MNLLSKSIAAVLKRQILYEVMENLSLRISQHIFKKG